MPDRETLKAAAAEQALSLVRPGMVLGLGTGSTARYFVEGVARLVRDGIDLIAVPSSRATAELARSMGVPLTEDPGTAIDLAVDGADEIDPRMGLIKGRGGAMVREKLVATAARRFVVIADDSKLVPRLGQGPIPVEVLPFLWRTSVERLRELGASCCVRGGAGGPFLSDNGNMIVDLSFPGGIPNPELLNVQLKQTQGVVDHGIFLNLAKACLIAGADGVRVIGSLD